MEEKILVKSESLIRRNLLLGVTVIIAIIAIILPMIMCYFAYDDNNESIREYATQAYEKATRAQQEHSMVCYHITYWAETLRSEYVTHYDPMWTCPRKHSSAESFATSFCQEVFQQRYNVNFYVFLTICLFFPLALFVIYLWLRNYELVVTDKRVYGRAAFGKRVDLPVDSVSAIGTMWLKGIAIATSSGKVAFLMIKNRDEIHKCVSDLLIDRQAKNTTPVTTIKQEIPQSNADELRKYKELLDMGVITQEEFEAKKKQLLGL